MVKWELILARPWTLAWDVGSGADGGGKYYRMKPTPASIAELGTAGSRSFVRGEERPPSLWQGGNMAGCGPFTTPIWVTLGMEGTEWH